MNWVEQFATVSLIHAAVGILLLDEHGIIHFANLQAEEYFGMPTREIEGMHVHTLVHKAKRQHATHQEETCPLSLLTREGKPTLRQTEMFWRKGTPCWVEYSMYPMQDAQGQKGFLLSFLDAEIAFHGKESYLTSKAKYRMVFEMSHDPKVMVTSTGEIRDANKASLTFFNKNTVVNENFFLLFPKDGRKQLREIWKVRQTQTVRLVPLEFHTDNDEELFIELTLVPNVLVGETLIIWRDTTARVLELRQREQFLALVGHELRTPLAVIKAFTQLLLPLTQQLQDKKIDRYLNHIHEKTDLLTNLINGMMDAIHLGSGKLEFQDQALSLDELTSGIVFELRKAYPETTFQLDGESNAILLLDKHRITQVISNLITNAVKYSPPHSTVHIRRFSEPTRAGVSVSDHGKGIPKSEQAKLFVPFFRGKAARNSSTRGLGLGLYLARQVVRHYKGKLQVESKFGKGSTFTISFPIHNA